MIKDSIALFSELQNYASPKAKLTRLLRSGQLVQVRRGLYVEKGESPVRALASVLYGPSYISFEYALAYHGMIPERVTTFTSACLGKNRSKRYATPFGEYTYRDIPQTVYPYAVRLELEDGVPFLIADPEKALCDSISKLSPIISLREMELLLLENWRMQQENLLRLDLELIAFLAPRYGRRSLQTLHQWMKRCHDGSTGGEA